MDKESIVNLAGIIVMVTIGIVYCGFIIITRGGM